MENKVSVNNNGVESSGLAKDYQQAIAEYIWNGFDANASHVSIDFETNAIDSLLTINVIDNGNGVYFKNLSDTFGNFLDSIKRASFQRSSYVRGFKGKGRFSFTAFSGKAIWHTVCLDSESQKYLEYDIVILKSKKDIYSVDNKKISTRTQTGTRVTFTDLFGVTAYNFYNSDFKDFLAREFGWFLFLNKDRNYFIEINGEKIVYEHLISESSITELQINDEITGNYDFKVTFLRWSESIGDKFYFYLLNAEKQEVGKVLTSYNNNAIGFNHSVFIESAFFNKFNINDAEQSGNLFESSKNSPVFKALVKRLQELLKEKYKFFVRGQAAEELIGQYERDGVIPHYRNNKYDQERRKDLVGVVKSIYCIEPKLFKGLSKEQQKVSVGLINLLLDSEERNNILELIGQIVRLNSEEREELTTLLKKTTIGKISKTINLLEARYKVIELLKLLVFDLKKFTSEIKHIQSVVEENFWILGEQYHLVSANEGFNKLLSKYLEVVNKVSNSDKKTKKVDNVESNRRPDVFICRKQCVPDSSDDHLPMEENLIVELKRPTVNIGKDQLRQVEDYLDIIINEEEFNSQKRLWKFYAISNKVDNYTKQQYEAFKDKGKRFLVKAIQNYEIYALTWDDVFMNFDLRHKFLVDKLEFDRSAIQAELKAKGITFSKDGSTTVLNEIITLDVQSD